MSAVTQPDAVDLEKSLGTVTAVQDAVNDAPGEMLGSGDEGLLKATAVKDSLAIVENPTSLTENLVNKGKQNVIISYIFKNGFEKVNKYYFICIEESNTEKENENETLDGLSGKTMLSSCVPQESIMPTSKNNCAIFL